MKRLGGQLFLMVISLLIFSGSVLANITLEYGGQVWSTSQTRIITSNSFNSPQPPAPGITVKDLDDTTATAFDFNNDGVPDFLGKNGDINFLIDGATNQYIYRDADLPNRGGIPWKKTGGLALRIEQPNNQEAYLYIGPGPSAGGYTANNIKGVVMTGNINGNSAGSILFDIPAPQYGLSWVFKTGLPSIALGETSYVIASSRNAESIHRLELTNTNGFISAQLTDTLNPPPNAPQAFRKANGFSTATLYTEDGTQHIDVHVTADIDRIDTFLIQPLSSIVPAETSPGVIPPLQVQNVDTQQVQALAVDYNANHVDDAKIIKQPYSITGNTNKYWGLYLIEGGKLLVTEITLDNNLLITQTPLYHTNHDGNQLCPNGVDGILPTNGLLGMSQSFVDQHAPMTMQGSAIRRVSDGSVLGSMPNNCMSIGYGFTLTDAQGELRDVVVVNNKRFYGYDETTNTIDYLGPDPTNSPMWISDTWLYPGVPVPGNTEQPEHAMEANKPIGSPAHGPCNVGHGCSYRLDTGYAITREDYANGQGALFEKIVTVPNSESAVLLELGNTLSHTPFYQGPITSEVLDVGLALVQHSWQGYRAGNLVKSHELINTIDIAEINTQGNPQSGSTMSFTLSDPLHPNTPYIFGAALTDTPGIMIGDGRVIPLTFDDLLNIMVNNPNSIGFSHTIGTLDNDGKDTITWNVPNVPGTTVYFSFITLDNSVIGPERILSIAPAIPLTVST